MAVVPVVRSMIVDRPALKLIFEFFGALKDGRLDRKGLTLHKTEQPEDEDENKNRRYTSTAKLPSGCAR